MIFDSNNLAAIENRLKSRGLLSAIHDPLNLLSTLTFNRITATSSDVAPGSIFVATRGTRVDAHSFIDSVASNPASHQKCLILGELPSSHFKLNGTPYIQVTDSAAALSHLASLMNGDPSHSLLVLGITGTSGKTTTSFLLESIVNACGYKVGVIGTVENRVGSTVFESTHTTPGPIELQALLAKMKNLGAQAIVMEVSSHALKQRRVEGITFDGAVFLNLSPEHLDYHPDMEDYYQAKKRLFTDLAELSKKSSKKFLGVVNTSDPYGMRMAHEVPSVIGFKEPSWKSSPHGIQGTIDSIPFQSNLFGPFNIQNLSAAVALAENLGTDRGFTTPKIIQGIETLKAVPGRLEKIPNTRGIHAFVDYAHKPDAFEKVLKMFREQAVVGRLIMVFGCGGDRDTQKRPVMGKMAYDIADLVVVTSDNPRTEDPDKIISQILAGMPANPENRIHIEPDRKKAIQLAVRLAKPGDYLIVAGKGHETYQLLGSSKVHFDDREELARAILGSKPLTDL